MTSYIIKVSNGKELKVYGTLKEAKNLAKWLEAEYKKLGEIITTEIVNEYKKKENKK